MTSFVKLTQPQHHTILTSDRDFGKCLTLADIIGGDAFVHPCIILCCQVDLEVSPFNLSGRRQAAIDLTPLEAQGWGAMGQALQADYFTHTHGHVVGQGSGIGWGCSDRRDVS